MAHVVRLCVDHPLGAGQSVLVSREQAHRLFSVMRLAVGAQVLLFNGHDGEWYATVEQAGKRGGILVCQTQTKPQQAPPDLWLLFAPIKKTRTDFIVEKATELGAARILPVQTAHTNSERIRQDRLQQHAVEAAEQCGGTFVPPVEGLQNLSKLLDAWPEDRHLLFCDEATVDGVGATAQFAKLPERGAPWAIVIGPEGGFSEAERERLRRRAHVVSLGPRILRADTAAVAALTLWQAHMGDWV